VRKSKLTSSVPSVEVSCDNVNGYSSLNQELDSSLPNSADAGNIGTDDSDVQMSPLFSSPSAADDDDDDIVERDNFIQNIVSMLTPDVISGQVQAVSTKTTADKATETNDLWDLDDIDDLFQVMDSSSEPAAASSCEVSVSESSTLPVHNSTLDSTQLPAVSHNGHDLWNLDDIDDLFQVMDSSSEPAAASSCEVSISESSTLPVHNSTLDSTQLPAVSHNGQNNMSSASGNCSVHAVCPLLFLTCHSQRIKISSVIAWPYRPLA